MNEPELSPYGLGRTGTKKDPGRSIQLNLPGSREHERLNLAMHGDDDTTALASKLLYRPEEAAAVMSLSRTAVYGLISSGELEAVKIGGRRRIPRRAINDYIAWKLAADGRHS